MAVVKESDKPFIELSKDRLEASLIETTAENVYSMTVVGSEDS